MGMRNSELKKALNSFSVNSRGVFDKPELAALLVEKQLLDTGANTAQPESAEKKLEVDMIDVMSSNVPGAKDFIGVRITDKRGNSLICMVDTAASTNLITSAAVDRLNLPRQAFNQYGSGLGGQAQIANSKTTLSEMAFFGTPETPLPVMDASILSNPSMLPPSVDILLGLPFLQSLQSLVMIDLKKKKFTFMLGTMPADSLEDYHKIGFRRAYPTGLLLVDALVDQKGQVDAMVDIGSTYSILSKEAVGRVLGKDINQLQMSPTVSAGITGQPMTMRECTVDSLLLGNRINIAKQKLYAADIPQLEAIGLGKGMLLLGLDVLAAYDEIAFCFRENVMYLRK